MLSTNHSQYPTVRELVDPQAECEGEIEWLEVVMPEYLMAPHDVEATYIFSVERHPGINHEQIEQERGLQGVMAETVTITKYGP